MLHQAEDVLAKPQLVLSEALSQKERVGAESELSVSSMLNPKAFGENASQKILELEAQIEAMREAEETLNLELKEVEASVKADEKKGSDLESNNSVRLRIN